MTPEEARSIVREAIDRLGDNAPTEFLDQLCAVYDAFRPGGTFRPEVLLEGWIPVAWEPRWSQRGYATVRIYRRAFSPRRVMLVEVPDKGQVE